jgi:FkbH-like protein
MDKTNLKKAIIFDCDNTLWKGVVGEGDVEHNSDIQQDIVFLSNRGVIIGLCSKNNEQDVLDALKDQILTMDFISAYRINWKDKASNLREIAEELNIGLDAIVFVDDSMFELELVMELLPEVMCILPEQLMNTASWWFDLSGDYSKTQQYKDNFKRERAKEAFSDINSYLASLDMSLKISVNNWSQSERIAELTQKTNQFNLAKHPYDEEIILAHMALGRVYTISVADRFGDNGLTGVCIINSKFIKTFLLSCRILGRGIEYAFMDYIVEQERNYGQIVLFGKYVPSAKNKQVENFYSDLGFECLDISDKGVTFVCRLEKYTPKAKDHFRYE